MKTIILCITLSLLIIGCGGGSSPAPEAFQAGNNNETYIDYTKVKCGSDSMCAFACDRTRPYILEANVRSACADAGIASNSGTCNSMVTWANDNYNQQNAACRNLSVADVMTVEERNSLACETNGTCRNYCSNIVLLTRQQIISQYGSGNGASLRAMVSNQSRIAEQKGCMGAPVSFIRNRML